VHIQHKELSNFSTFIKITETMLTIFIPNEIEHELSSLTNDKPAFIIAAIKQKIAMRKKAITSEELAKEYADGVDENKLITEDFKNADIENWDDY